MLKKNNNKRTTLLLMRLNGISFFSFLVVFIAAKNAAVKMFLCSIKLIANQKLKFKDLPSQLMLQNKAYTIVTVTPNEIF